jgi:hypothetical protein
VPGHVHWIALALEVQDCSSPDRPVEGCTQTCLQALDAQAAAALAARPLEE